LYVRGRTNPIDSRQSWESKDRSLKVKDSSAICQYEDHLNINCLKNNRKKSTGNIKKDEQPSSSGSTFNDSENVRNQNGLIGVQGNGNQNQIWNGNLVAIRAEGNGAGHNGNLIRCYNCKGVEEYNLMAAPADLDEIKKVNTNCILMANLQQTSSSGTQTDSTPVYDSDGSAELIRLNHRRECYDMLVACKSKAEIGSTKSLLKKEFNMKELEEAKKNLGMKMVRDRSRKIMRVSQSEYVSKILLAVTLLK
nr:retrovirus-related Pol polyprotein from transposon TNT 1-94 [Tanacetum cinerariifolium]